MGGHLLSTISYKEVAPSPPTTKYFPQISHSSSGALSFVAQISDQILSWEPAAKPDYPHELPIASTRMEPVGNIYEIESFAERVLSRERGQATGLERVLVGNSGPTGRMSVGNTRASFFC